MPKTPEQFAVEISLYLDVIPSDKQIKTLTTAIKDRDFIMMTSPSEKIGGTVV